MGLHPESAKITGSIKLHGEELLNRPDESMSTLRGESIAMIFQDPLSALTPVYSIGDQIVEAIQVHHDVSKAAATKRAVELSTWWEFPTRGAGEVLPARILRRHAARAMIAMSLPAIGRDHRR